MTFDPLPDADNAAVGSHMGFFGDTRTGISIFILRACSASFSARLFGKFCR